MPTSRRRAWLVGATCLGCILAGTEILHGSRLPRPLRHGVAARVNDHDIDEDSVSRTISGMQSGARNSIADARGRVIQRMIDEQLLVEHALRAGAADTDPEVRAALVRSAINRINEETAATPATQRELLAYYEAHAAAYATSSRYEVVPLYFASRNFPELESALAQAAAARTALDAGQPVAVVSKRADELPFTPASGALSTTTLENYYGEAAAAAVASTALGTATLPLPFGRGVLVLYVKAKAESSTREFSSVRDLVAADFTRDVQERALEKALNELRREARIDLASPH